MSTNQINPMPPEDPDPRDPDMTSRPDDSPLREPAVDPSEPAPDPTDPDDQMPSDDHLPADDQLPGDE